MAFLSTPLALPIDGRQSETALAIARVPMERISAAPAVNPLSQEPHRAANSASTSVRQRALLDS